MNAMNLPSFTTAISGSSSSITHKRTRADDPPSLPQITSDLLLQVYTHPSLRRHDVGPEEHGDNERLTLLGRVVLEAAVTSALFNRRPMLHIKNMLIQRESAISVDSIKHWVNMYDMTRRLRCHPDVFAVLNTAEEAQSLFHAYLGAVYTEHGLEATQQWIGQLLSEDYDGITLPPPFVPPPKKIKNDGSPASIPPPIFFGSQPPPSLPKHNSPSFPPSLPPPPPPSLPPPPPPPPKLSNPLSPAQPGLSFLPLFNQMATQRRVTVDYPAEFAGPPHAGRWTIRCVVNGISKGLGTGSNKQIAKEEAARQAYYAMGWT